MYVICKSKLIPGSNYKTVSKIARKIFNQVKSKTKRRPYLRSTYFGDEKIFLDNFWPHLKQKNPANRALRLKFLQGAIEMIQHSKKSPFSLKQNSAKKENLYRFLGRIENHYFIVQIKEDLKRSQKFFMSVFPYTKK